MTYAIECGYTVPLEAEEIDELIWAACEAMSYGQHDGLEALGSALEKLRRHQELLIQRELRAIGTLEDEAR